MKFSININQGSIADHKLAGKTDLVDWAIIDYIKDWQTNPKAVKYNDMVWLNYKRFIEQMPLLNLNTKASISKRLKKLFDLDLIDVFKDADSRVYVIITDKAHSIISFKGSSKSEGLTKVNWGLPELTGVNERKQGVNDGKRGVNESLHSLEQPLLEQHLLEETAEGVKTQSDDKKPNEPKSAKTWSAYSRAYCFRYGHEPVRNQSVNSMLCKLVDFVGAKEAPYIADYYLRLNKTFYTQSNHPVSLLIRDYQSIRSQWINQTNQTSNDYRQAERRSSMASKVAAIQNKIKSRGNS